MMLRVKGKCIRGSARGEVKEKTRARMRLEKSSLRECRFLAARQIRTVSPRSSSSDSDSVTESSIGEDLRPPRTSQGEHRLA